MTDYRGNLLDLQPVTGEPYKPPTPTRRSLLHEECSTSWLEDGPWPIPTWDHPGIYVRARCPTCKRSVSALLGKVA